MAKLSREDDNHYEITTYKRYDLHTNSRTQHSRPNRTNGQLQWSSKICCVCIAVQSRCSFVPSSFNSTCPDDVELSGRSLRCVAEMCSLEMVMSYRRSSILISGRLKMAQHNTLGFSFNQNERRSFLEIFIILLIDLAGVRLGWQWLHRSRRTQGNSSFCFRFDRSTATQRLGCCRYLFALFNVHSIIKKKDCE